MTSRGTHVRVWVWLAALALVGAACSGEGDTAEESAEESTAGNATETVAEEGSEAATDDESGATSDLRVAGVFPGSTTDADYNTLGLLALEDAESSLGVEIAFSESVPVPDVERAMREYVSQDFNVIWTHGSQFYEQTAELARENPDVNFIGESDVEPEDAPDNLWVIDREFHVGFYPIGALAGMASETGRVGYIGGLSLPFSYAEVHAMEQAIDDLELDVEIVPVWTGDFNDPAAARQTASEMLSQDIDVIVGSLNLGMVGVFEAVNESDDALVTAKYTDKSQFSEERYVSSVLYDFSGPLEEILTSIISGETSGYYPLGFDTGVSLQDPQNVEDATASEVDAIVADVESGAVEVVENFEPIE